MAERSGSAGIRSPFQVRSMHALGGEGLRFGACPRSHTGGSAGARPGPERRQRAGPRVGRPLDMGARATRFAAAREAPPPRAPHHRPLPSPAVATLRPPPRQHVTSFSVTVCGAEPKGHCKHFFLVWLPALADAAPRPSAPAIWLRCGRLGKAKAVDGTPVPPSCASRSSGCEQGRAGWNGYGQRCPECAAMARPCALSPTGPQRAQIPPSKPDRHPDGFCLQETIALCAGRS